MFRIKLMCIVGLLIGSSSGQVFAADPTAEVFQLTSGNDMDVLPAVSGTTYVWQRGTHSSNARIMMWNEGDPAPVQISDTTRAFAPHIDQGRVVYQNKTGTYTDFEINLWENGVITVMTDNTDDDLDPDIGGFGMVWRVQTWYLMYDNGEERIQITAGEGTVDEQARVMDDWVVWRAGAELYLWDNGVTTQLTDNTYNDTGPETDGQTIVWHQRNGPNGENSDIMRWTPAQGIMPLTTIATFDTQADVSGDVVVFARDDGNDFEIFFHYLGRDYQITDNDFDDFEPNIDGDRVVWHAKSSDDDYDIYYAVLSGLEGGEMPGACCTGVECTYVTPTECAALEGTFIGPEIFCNIDICPDARKPASGWSTFQHDAQRTGSTTAVIPAEPVRLWSLLVGNATVDLAPTIGPDGTIYVDGESELLVAVHPDGILHWWVDFAGEFAAAPPAIRQDGHFFLPKWGTIGKFSRIDGSGLCGQPIGMRPAPALDDDGNCYYPGGMMDASCNPIWDYTGGGGLWSHVALDQDGHVYISGSFAYVKIDPADGTQEWLLETTGQPGAPAIGPDGTSYLHVTPNTLLAINPDGSEKWNLPLTGMQYVQPAPSPAIGVDGTVYVVSKENGDPALVAVSVSGGELWRVAEPGGFDAFSPVIDGDGTVIFPVQGTDLIALSSSDGAERWRIDLGGGDYVVASPAIGEDGTLYVKSNKGYLIALGEGCPEEPPEQAPFSYREVARMGDVINGYMIDDFVSSEIDADGLVTFQANSSGSSSAVFRELPESGFDVIAQGTILGGFEIDSVALPRRDDNGRSYMGAYVAGYGPAIFVDETLYVAEHSGTNAPVLLETISEWEYVGHDESENFLVLGKQYPTDSETLLSVDSDSAEISVVLAAHDIVGGFQIDSLEPDPVDGYGDDGTVVLQVYNGHFAIVTQDTLIAKTDDVIEGHTLSYVGSPRLTVDGTIYFRGDSNVYSHSPEGGLALERSSYETVAGHPIRDIESFAVNEEHDLVYFANLLGTRGIFYNSRPLAIQGVGVIDGLHLGQVGGQAFDEVSVNKEGEVAFVAARSGEPLALYVAAFDPDFDSDDDGDVDQDDYDELDDCYTGPEGTATGCGCAGRFGVNGDLDIDCGDWEYFKQDWTGPPTYPPFRPACDLDCNGDSVADEFDIAGGISADNNDNGIPDECDCVSLEAPRSDPSVTDFGHGTKNRYLSLMAGTTGRQQAILVTILSLPGYEYAEGRSMWVQAPHQVTEASDSSGNTPPPTFWAAELGCAPHYTDWVTYGVIDVFDNAILPNAVFEVRATDTVCDIGNPEHYSDPLVVTLSSAGDVVGNTLVPPPPSSPQGVVEFVDISGCVDKFKNTPGAPRKARADVINSTVTLPLPDQKIDFVDISCIVEAFRGAPCALPGPPLTDPCEP